MDVTEFNRLKDQLEALDNSPRGKAVVRFGSAMRGRTFADVAQNEPGFRRWCIRQINPRLPELRWCSEEQRHQELGPLYKFYLFDQERINIVASLQKMSNDELEKLNQQRKEKADAARLEVKRVAKLRHSTANYNHLCILCEMGLLQSCVFTFLPLESLLRLSRVCRVLRDATVRHPDWKFTVAGALAKCSPHTKVNTLDARRRLELKAKRFFKIPWQFALPALEYDATNTLRGYEEHLRLEEAAKSFDPKRDELRRAIQDWKKKVGMTKTALSKMLPICEAHVQKTVAASIRVKTAVEALQTFYREHRIGHKSVEAKFEAEDLNFWEKFANPQE